MLGLLLCLSASCLVAAAAPVTYQKAAAIDISACPIAYYGVQYTELYISLGSNNELMLCFGAAFVPDNYADCVVTTAVNPTDYTVDVGADVSRFDSAVQSALSNITSSSICGIHLSMTFDESSAASDFYFMSFGTHAAAHVVANVKFGNIIFFATSAPKKMCIFKTAGPHTENVDLAGCREKGNVYGVNAAVNDPDTCSDRTCLQTGVFADPVSSCTSPNICIGNNRCETDKFCSVIGPSVIDVNNMAAAIPNFCTYNLMSVPGLKIVGFFKSHRLTDVPFLHTLYLETMDGLNITHGGVATKKVNNVEEEVPLSMTPVTVFGVELTKNDTGVTAKFTGPEGYITKVFYDGALLHITQRVSQSSHPSVTGVCETATSATSFIIDKTSDATCKSVVQDTDGDNIHCDDVTLSCSNKLTLLSTALGCAVDTTPYIQGCAEKLLCIYPNVDQLDCSFLDAYARTCKAQKNWRDNFPSCPISACVNHVCGSDEFCAINDRGNPACFCQDIFAIPYRSSSFFGHDPTCSGDTASTTLFTCFLEENLMDYKTLHLKNASCVGTYNDSARTVTFGFSGSKVCGGDIKESGNQIVYNNTIERTQDGTVSFESPVSIEFSCAYTQPTTVSTASFTIVDGSVTMTYTTANFTFTIVISPFADAAMTKAVDSSTPVALDQKLWVKLEAQDVGAGNLALLIDHCWGTENSAPEAMPKYDLITNSCVVPSDGSVELVSNGDTLTAVFAFNTFEFVGAAPNNLNLHCKVQLCIIGTNCSPTCT